MMQMNRHFAAQGYAVFDLRYGLRGDPARPPVVKPRHVLGPYTLDDMMRRLGLLLATWTNTPGSTTPI